MKHVKLFEQFTSERYAEKLDKAQQYAKDNIPLKDWEQTEDYMDNEEGWWVAAEHKGRYFIGTGIVGPGGKRNGDLVDIDWAYVDEIDKEEFDSLF
jgi:hypothetical protein